MLTAQPGGSDAKSSALACPPPASISTGNNAFVQQIGSGNTLQTLEQTAKDATSGNYAEVYQGYAGNWSANSTTATVSQTASNGALNQSRTYR